MSSVNWVYRQYGQSYSIESRLKAPFSSNYEKHNYIRVGTTIGGDVLNYFGNNLSWVLDYSPIKIMLSVDWVCRQYGQRYSTELTFKALFPPNFEKHDYIRVGTTFGGDVLNYF